MTYLSRIRVVLFFTTVCTIAGLSWRPALAQVVDRNTLTHKVMCGYQGWFAAPGDATTPQIGWWHWSNDFASGAKYHFDMWPDLTEFGAGELFTAPNVTLLDNSPGKLYSAATPASVNRHFKWMKDYGIDGVFLQRFLWDINPGNNPGFKSHHDLRLANVRAGANAHGRVFAVEYDISGEPVATIYQNIVADWKDLVDNRGLLSDPRYLKHNGKPVVGIWGLGFSGRGITPALAQQIIDFFKHDPVYGNNIVMGGVPGAWRTRNSDSESGPAWGDVYHSFDIINPWTVGRYSNVSQVYSWKTSRVIPDKAECDLYGQKYMPVIFPGFSWDNLMGYTAGTSLIHRRGGDFFWKQIAAYKDAGCQMFFVAMFDEVNEGTAIYKISDNHPFDAPAATPPPPYQWITNDGLGNDWFLKLTGAATQMANGAFAPTATIPIPGWSTTGSGGLVISQIYGGGGTNTQSNYRNDFVELYNAGSTTVNFATTNCSVQYTTATGSAWQKFDLTAGSVAPGRHFLVKFASGGANGALLPTEDADGSASGINLDSNAGKVALARGTNAISGAAYPPALTPGDVLTDYVGYGPSASAHEGYPGPVQADSTARNDMSFTRTQDTNQNANDLFYGFARARNSAYTPPINNGAIDGTVHVNAAGGTNYTSLATALADINQAYGGINANWSVLIDGDLTEPQNLAIGCKLAAGKRITIKPIAGANPVITLTGGSLPNLNAHLFIGPNSTMMSGDVNMYDMGGLTIDGSNNGTDSRNLTIQNSAAAGATYISSVLRLLGANNGTIIRNCTIKNLSTNSSTQDQCCIKIDTRSSFIDLRPSNVRIGNCNLQAFGSRNGVALRTDTQGVITTGTATGQTGMQFVRNTISARSRALKLAQTASALITSNTITMSQSDTTAEMIAIEHSGSNDDSGWTVTIGDNSITTLNTSNLNAATAGATAIALRGAGTGTGGSYIVYNNMIGGFNFFGPSTNLNYRGIYIGDANVNATIYSNSINMPSLGSTNPNALAIALANASYSGTANIRNNIVRILQPGGAALYFGNANTATVTSDYNDLFASGADVARRGATTYSTLAAWQTASGKDANSISSDPTVPHSPASGVWVAAASSPNNLRFSNDPGTDFSAPVISGFTWDIDGTTRTFNTRNKGVHAVSAAPARVSGWEIY